MTVEKALYLRFMLETEMEMELGRCLYVDEYDDVDKRFEELYGKFNFNQERGEYVDRGIR